ncbi:MAG: hypothetical protein L0Y80_11535 [Ignavibacteriae bacterium]|nr:hypothetical protein [Ignavibacteriota bacterium]
MKTQLLFIILLLSCSLLLTGCFPGGGYYHEERQAGFFSGVWHGWIAPASLVYGSFEPSVHIYEPNNTGWWYDLGFYLAVIGGFGGISVLRRKKG